MSDINELRELDRKISELKNLPQMEKELAQEDKIKRSKLSLARYGRDFETLVKDFKQLKSQIEDDKASVKISLEKLLLHLREITNIHGKAQNVARHMGKEKYKQGVGLWSKHNSPVTGHDILHEANRIFEHYGVDENLTDLQKLAKVVNELDQFLSAKPKERPIFNIVDHDPDTFHVEI